MTENVSYIGESIKRRPPDPVKQNKYFKSEAKKALLSYDNHMRCVISMIISGIVSGGFIYCAYLLLGVISAGFAEQLGQTSAEFLAFAVFAVISTVGFFALFASLLGSYTMSCRMIKSLGKDDKNIMSALFEPLSSFKNFSDTFSLFVIFMVEISGFAALMGWVLKNANEFTQNEIYAVLLKTAAITVFVFIVLFFAYMFSAYPYIKDGKPEISAVKAYFKSAKLSIKGLKHGIILFFSFIPLLLMSISTFFVGWFAFTGPYLQMSCAEIGEYIYTKANLERNINNNEQT